ncbi:MAG: 50S ribosomal protein L25/general stress protein Ctc [Flavobacteriaceae bacterium]|nr:50S ribosomal protein L25/general stress protein Ctc [Flavobacteriaceae bacterium]
MKSITINGSKRESVGKSSTKALRNAGKVPCVLYGGEKPVHFSVEEISFSKLVYTPNAHTLTISIDSKTEINAVIQDIQFHPVTEKILHIDFLQIFEDKEVTITVPVRFEGNAPGVRNQGGNLSKNKRKLNVRALPKDLPDFIKADISSLNLNDNITIADVSEETFKFLHPDNMVICQVKMSRASLSLSTNEETEEGEEGAEKGEAGENSTSEGSDSPKTEENSEAKE